MEAADERALTRSRTRILVVDDEHRILRFVARGLQAEGFEVDSADNGAEALRRALATDYDLVVLDLLMPGMDGATVLSRLLAARPRQAVIVLSCLTATATKVRCLEAGAEDYLAKPFSLDELLAAVWHYHFDPGSNVVDVYVRRLRAKLGAEAVVTVRGEGYRIATQ